MSHPVTLLKMAAAIENVEKQTPCRSVIFKALRKYSEYFSGDEGYFFHYLSENDSYIMGVLPMTESPHFLLDDGEYEQYMLLKNTGMDKQAMYLYFLMYGVENQCKTS